MHSSWNIFGSNLHIIGHARTGTTFFMDVLNSSSEVFLTSELNLHVLLKYPDAFSIYGGTSFIEQFHLRKQSELPNPYKGSRIPLPIDSDIRPIDLLDKLKETHRFSGDKIAVLNRDFGGTNEFILLQDFINQESVDGARFFYTLRRPSSTILSVNQMFPAMDLQDICLSVLKTLQFQFYNYLTNSKSIIVFLEDVSPVIIEEIEKMFDIKLCYPRKLTIAKNSRRRLPAKFTTSTSAKLRIELDALDDIYDEIKNCFKHERSTLKLFKGESLGKGMTTGLMALESAIEGYLNA